MRRLRVIPERCSGCKICELLCSMGHNEEAFSPRKALIRVETNRSPEVTTPVSQIDNPNVCLQCDPAPCAESCPVEAFKWDEGSEIWEIDGELCTGCGACADECQYNMIVMDNDTATKCDLCNGDPICVRYCPTGAISFS